MPFALNSAAGTAFDGVVLIAPDYAHLCEHVAGRIADLVRAKPDAVLGLATGSTPIGVYDLLARDHREAGLDFSRVTCFNLDEYYPMPPNSPHSYHWFMERHLFSRINCTRWCVPDGQSGTPDEIADRCRRYEAAIVSAGGIDLQLLGIGRTGHLGFNEPGSPVHSRTRVVTLHEATRWDAAETFGGIDQVPAQAISMGLGTILEARALLLMASGPGKAEIVGRMWTGDVMEQIPASLARRHPCAQFCLDAAAAAAID